MADRDRLIVLPGVILITALAWAWIVPMASDMYGSMSGAAARADEGTSLLRAAPQLAGCGALGVIYARPDPRNVRARACITHSR